MPRTSPAAHALPPQPGPPRATGRRLPLALAPQQPSVPGVLWPGAAPRRQPVPPPGRGRTPPVARAPRPTPAPVPRPAPAAALRPKLPLPHPVGRRGQPRVHPARGCLAPVPSRPASVRAALVAAPPAKLHRRLPEKRAPRSPALHRSLAPPLLRPQQRRRQHHRAAVALLLALACLGRLATLQQSASQRQEYSSVQHPRQTETVPTPPGGAQQAAERRLHWLQQQLRPQLPQGPRMSLRPRRRAAAPAAALRQRGSAGASQGRGP
mmetsp:Transcript_16643/g.52404  ORF Transcript_16643/g.52404 Transcript_16643/m.52404 type:complete len:266 (-) Transcript_16643:77-874(-)